MRAKETLQLRHQLSASGLSLRAATYDTKRHHVLTFDSHPLRPHVLRLFSLRRELRSVPLFDKSEGESTTKRPTSSNSSTQAHKRPSFFEQQLQQKEKRLNQSNVEVVVPIMLLQYSAKLDVFICVYSKATRPKGATQVPKITSHYVMLVEPGTLRILLIYEGPETNLLQCAHYDSLTDRVVLASYLKSEEGDGLMLPQAPKNVAEILQMSKRLDDQDYWSTGSVDQEEPRMLLFIENTRASLRYPDKLAVICGSKGLRELYGASSDRSSSTDAVCTLLHWRQKQANVGKLMLVRRVLLRHRITAMVVSPCGDWLLAGFCDGSLKVWNVNGTRTNGSELFTIDAEPYEPPESSVTGSQDEEICSIEIIASSTPNSTDAGSTDMVVIAAERDTGAVRHWKFSVERKIFAHGDDTSAGGHRYPRLRLVGYFNAGVKKQMGKEENPTKFKNQDTLGPALKTLVMCITIDMGSCFENLLLVVREDVIHVLKVQTVLYVMQEFAEVEEVYAVRGIIQQNENKVLSLSRTAVSKFRIFGLTDSSSETPSSKLLFAPPQISSTSVHVSLMETISNERMQLSFIVLTWSNGVVNVYDVLRENCVMQLQDKRLTDQISTLSVVTFSRTTPLNASVVREEDQFYTSRSSWSLAQGESSSSNACTDESDNLARRKLFIVVGTERGKLFGWSAGVLRSGDYTFQSVQKANVHVHAAHSSHIIQLAHVDTLIHGERALLASIGAGGIIKLWSIPSLKVVGHVNSIAEGYPATPSCLELLRREGPMKGRELYASVGYEDGRVAVWSVNFKQILFQRLDTSTRHERRVSKICRIPNDVVLTGLTEFLSCSLDMTVIQWQISGSGTVDEKRYFDIGAAIVDMILIQEHVVLALAHEVCKFEFAPSSGINIEYRIKPRTEIDGGEGDKDENEKQASIHADMQLIGDKYPDSPTTRSVEDPVSPSRRPSRSVDEYLTLHVPTAIHLEDTEASTDSAPATRDQNEDFVNSRTEDADKIPRHLQGSKSADNFQLSLINDDVLRGYLQEYIAHYGTGGTMAANRITHLLAIRPELPSVRRPGFALAKTLKILKLSAQDRLDPEEALYILRLLFAMPTVSNTSFDAPIMVHTLKEKNNRSEKAHAQRLREKKQALRKSVVTYNLLGEKCVRWEESLAEQEKCDQNQSQSSPISPCVVQTPQSPTMHKTRFEQHSPLDDDGSVDIPPEVASNSATKDDGVRSDAISTHTTPRSPPTYSEPLNPSPSKSDEHIATNTSGKGSIGNNNENIAGNVDEDDVVVLKEQSHVKMVHPVTKTTAKKSVRNKQVRSHNDCSGRMLENALMNSIRLSPMFQQFWTKGYCWCWPASRLHITWTNEADNKNSENRSTKVRRRGKKCGACHKRLHTIELPRSGYTPHFSRQATFGIIVEVYSKLATIAHSRLYKSGSTKIERVPECSIFSAIYEVFLATYGMRNIVQMKLKLFFVSMCHYLSEYDAVAVFGELLGLHKSGIADEYDHAPSTLVALCVCCYSWLYSRGMVVNGDSFSGQLRGSEWGNSFNTTTTEVLPATDGTTHWQVVRVEHALLCAQDNLLYPLVSPGFLQSVMVYMQEYAQASPTRSLRTDSPDFGSDDIGRNGGNPVLWIELHRILRLLVGEWKHQNAHFRVTERLLFIYPQHDAALEGDLIEKLQLMLSCFVFYDHDRVGAMTITDFETLLFKFRYLWTEESSADEFDTAFNDMVFENTMSAIKKRFLDVSHDGQLCYLDFWAMLYIVGLKTRGLINFHEIPSFCRNYKLEVSPELSDMVWNYMQLSCTLLLPKGLQVGKSSLDQKARRQHRRRVGGLHDGTFHFSKTLKGSLSTQELLARNETKMLGLFLDGSVPATRQTASTTALDRFRPVEAEFGSDGSSGQHSREPVVVGVRSIGPTTKPIAPLRVSTLGNCDLAGRSMDSNYLRTHHDYSLGFNRTSLEIANSGYTNIHIQFPQVPPVRWRVGRNEVVPRPIIRNVPMDGDSEGNTAICEEPTMGREEIPVVTLPTESESTRPVSSRSAVSASEPVPLAQEEPVIVEQPKSPLEKRRSTTPVVVVPTVEAESLTIRTNSPNEKRKSSPGLVRVVSDLIRLEEETTQLDPEEVSPPRPPTPVLPVLTVREETPRENDRDEVESVISSHNVSEDADDGEQPIESSEEFFPEEINEPVPIIVEEVVPEPEPIVLIPVEIVEPVVEQPNIEEENDSDALVVLDETPELIVVVDVPEHIKTTVDEEVIPIPTPPSIDEPISIEVPESEPDEPSAVASEEALSESTDDTPYTPQIINEDDIQIHNAYRFSQQPTFLDSVAVANKLDRPAMWNPNDDNDDDSESSTEMSNNLSTNSGHLNVNVYDELSSFIAKEDHASATSSHQLTRFDPLQQGKRDNKASSFDVIKNDDDGDGGASTDIPLMAFKRKRLDDDAERALYGERVIHVLGEGISFSQEAEAAMQQKWQHFFDYSESNMFTTMRQDLEKKQAEQRDAEEKQRKLRKKWQEQRDQDLLRLQHSRQTNIVLISTKQADASNGTVDASFRLRRIERESCRQVTEELQFGVSVQRELKDANGTQLFHFYYLPESQGTIITLKMHILGGDAEVFMSTDTKVPCATDFMWRSFERMTKDSGDGHRIILYPQDLQKAVTATTAKARTEQVAMIERMTKTASMRSLYSKQADVPSVKVGFYLSVVALEPDTTFKIAVMSSGQKMEQSRAMQTVDYLIDRFNMISRSFEGQSTVPYPSPVLPSDDIESDTMDEGDGDDNDGTDNELTETTRGRSKTKKIAGAGVDPQELKSFQYLLESLSQRKGFGSPRAGSILLAGPNEEHLEFVQDEDNRLQELRHRLSPSKTCLELYDPISVVTERRLTLQGKRRKLRRVVAARLQHKLSPLQHKSVAGGELEKSAGIGGLVMNTAPRPIAYSITTLDPLPRSQRHQVSYVPLKHSSSVDNVSADKSMKKE